MSVESRVPGSRPAGRLLVVDDQATNRQLLAEILETHGYEVIEAESGRQALELAGPWGVDAVLLDVSMPGMSGLDVCRALREAPATAALPILLVTALAHRDQRLEGIAAGANDYLTKPVDRTDLILRVRNAVQMRRYHVALAEQYARLQRLEQLRDGLVHMLVHDLRSPLTGMTFAVEAIKQDVADLARPTLTEDLDMLGRQVRVLTEMVSNVLDVSRFEASAMPLHRTDLDLRAVVREAVASLGLGARAAKVELVLPDDAVPGRVDGGVLRRVVANLVDNALKFGGTRGTVRVSLAVGEGGAILGVSDQGPGVPASEQARIFDKFGRVEGNGAVRGTGLGLTFCKLAVEAHGGLIGVTSDQGQGATFWVRLPLGAEADGGVRHHSVESDGDRIDRAGSDLTLRRQ